MGTIMQNGIPYGGGVGGSPISGTVTTASGFTPWGDQLFRYNKAAANIRIASYAPSSLSSGWATIATISPAPPVQQYFKVPLGSNATNITAWRDAAIRTDGAVRVYLGASDAGLLIQFFATFMM